MTAAPALKPPTEHQSPQTVRRRPRVRRLVRIRVGFYYSTSTALAVLFVLPLLWTGWSSVNGPRASGGDEGFGLANYVRLATYGEGIGTYLLNSTVVAVLTVAGTLAVSVLGGYAFARFRFPGRQALFLATLAILMVPYATLLVPLYILLGYVGLQNSLVGLSLVLVMFQLPFALFMMRNAFEGLPRELEEAALVDGCSHLTALRSILLPAVVPAMITVGMFAFLASWNEFIAPLIFLTDGSQFTLPVALASLRSGNFGAIDYGALQAGTVVSAVPCMVVFLLLQRYYVKGFTSGALKG